MRRSTLLIQAATVAALTVSFQQGAFIGAGAASAGMPFIPALLSAFMVMAVLNAALDMVAPTYSIFPSRATLGRIYDNDWAPRWRPTYFYRNHYDNPNPVIIITPPSQPWYSTFFSPFNTRYLTPTLPQQHQQQQQGQFEMRRTVVPASSLPTQHQQQQEQQHRQQQQQQQQQRILSTRVVPASTMQHSQQQQQQHHQPVELARRVVPASQMQPQQQPRPAPSKSLSTFFNDAYQESTKAATGATEMRRTVVPASTANNPPFNPAQQLHQQQQQQQRPQPQQPQPGGGRVVMSTRIVPAHK